VGAFFISLVRYVFVFQRCVKLWRILCEVLHSRLQTVMLFGMFGVVAVVVVVVPVFVGFFRVSPVFQKPVNDQPALDFCNTTWIGS